MLSGFSYRGVGHTAKGGSPRRGGRPKLRGRPSCVPGVSWRPGQAARLPRDARDVREFQGRSGARHDLRPSVTVLPLLTVREERRPGEFAEKVAMRPKVRTHRGEDGTNCDVPWLSVTGHVQIVEER